MSDLLRDRLQASLGTAYTLGRELGGGGMARVFLARDETLGREVVIKVLPPEMGAGVSAERFTREIRLAAALQEPHIVPVHAAGATADGVPYYTMPYVRGESLRDRLTRGPVPLSEATGILRDMLHALAYAHAHSVVHRDIKPENVLLSSGTAVVTDFGIAKALSASTREGASHTAGAHTLTQVGTSLGTPAYMAPEQAAGDPTTDARADLYAWGVVAYELLAGRHPFAGKTTAHQLVAAHLTEVPAPLPTPPVPASLSALVTRCLAKNPAGRPATADETLRALEAASAPTNATSATNAMLSRRVLVGAAGIVLLVGGVAWLTWQHSHGETGSETPSGAVPQIAVLPFENAGPPDQAYVADGLTDEVRARLASVPGITVIARGSSNQYRQTTKPPQTIAAELGVRYLLTGTVRSEPGAAGRPERVRVTPELVEVTSHGPPLSRWQEPLDADAADVFAMEADIAGRVASALDVTLNAGTRARLAQVPTRSPAAYDAFLRGEAAGDGLARADAVALRRALTEYAQATVLDSTYADAWARRAQAASLLYVSGTPTHALAEEARTAAERAYTLAPRQPASALALGRYYEGVARDDARALALYGVARQLAPDDPVVLSTIGAVEFSLGRTRDALRDLQLAAARDPRTVVLASRLAFVSVWARHYADARTAADHALTLSPANPSLLERRAMVDLAEGDLPGARRVLATAPPDMDRDALVATLGNYWDLAWVLNDVDQRRLLALAPAAFDGDRAVWAWVLAQTYSIRGDSLHARAYADSAHQALQEQLRSTPRDGQRWVFDGLALAMLGRRTEAVTEAEKGTALAPVRADAVLGAYLQHQLVRVYLLTGQPDRALDVLERLLRMPYYLSPGWLRIDPTFAPLRGNPRFERLASGT